MAQPPPPAMDPQMQAQMQAAMMWQAQMQGGMMNPWGGVAPPVMPVTLYVRVEGLRFEYQLTEEDVRKVFARYGDVFGVRVEREGTAATVQFGQPHQAVAAQRDLDRKQLAGMADAYLRVEFSQEALNPMGMVGMPMPGFLGAPAFPMMPGYPGMPPMQMPGTPGSPTGEGRSKKYTCKLEVGIENDNDFRVGGRVIQIARQIWQQPRFQEFGGKTRLRGKGAGGPHEANEPLALCISCQDQAVLEESVQYAEIQMKKVHVDYIAHCEKAGFPAPEPELKVSRNGPSSGSDNIRGSSNDEVPRGERPSNAPTDEEIEKLIEERNEARKVANYKRSDEVRDYLKNVGVVLMDEKGAKGTNLKGQDVTKWRFWRP